MTLNPIDYNLIDLLQKNARITQSEMATAVGLSQPAVAERLRKLEQEGVITGYVARVNARRLGKDITAFIGVGIEHPKHNARFARKIQELPDVLECHRVTGSNSYLLKVVTENTETLDRLISENLRIIPGVTRTHTTIVMSSVKESTHVKPATEAKHQPRKRR
jgi:Lrp/AsnC family transcriptional regulator, leucine-responsive regulatory protein